MYKNSNTGEAKEVVKRIPRKDSGRVEKCAKKIKG